MGPQEQNVTAMQWRAPLIKLTCIGNPDIAGGEPTPTFVAPESISQIRMIKSGYAIADSLLGDPKDRRFHPQVVCTEVNCCHFILLVTESPETVARLRDQAFGFEPATTKSSVSSIGKASQD